MSVLTYSFAYCSGKKAGAVSVEDKALVRQIDSLHRVAKTEQKRADKEHARAESLEKKVVPARTRYITLRDTLQLTDTIEVKVALATADTVIVLQDSLVVTQKNEIFSLRNINDIRLQEIRGLNERMSIASKRIGRARREGFVVGFATAAFVAVTIKGLK